MKILHIISSMDPKSGGPCQGIRNSIKSLEHKVTKREVVTLDDPNASFLGMDNFPIHALGPALGLWQYSSKLSGWLNDNLERFDVVIINGLWLYSSYAMNKAINKLKKKRPNKPKPKVFVMPHGMLDPYFQKAKGRKLKAIRNWVYWKLIERKVINRAEGLLFTCETELELARKTFWPYNPKKEINISYGIEAPPVPTEKMRHAFFDKCPDLQGRPFLLFLSRIHAKKGVDILLRAYLSILRNSNGLKNSLPFLVIAGPGLESSYGRLIKEMVDNEVLLKSRVFFPGMLLGDAKWGAFYNCEAFILPSHQENFGIAVAEALACHKPVLISTQVNIWKEIQKEGGGFFANDTYEGTIKLLESWISLNMEERKKMEDRAFITFKKHFESSKVADRFFNAINS